MCTTFSSHKMVDGLFTNATDTPIRAYVSCPLNVFFASFWRLSQKLRRLTFGKLIYFFLCWTLKKHMFLLLSHLSSFDVLFFLNIGCRRSVLYFFAWTAAPYTTLLSQQNIEFSCALSHNTFLATAFIFSKLFHFCHQML